MSNRWEINEIGNGYVVECPYIDGELIKYSTEYVNSFEHALDRLRMSGELFTPKPVKQDADK